MLPPFFDSLRRNPPRHLAITPLNGATSLSFYKDLSVSKRENNTKDAEIWDSLSVLASWRPGVLASWRPVCSWPGARCIKLTGVFRLVGKKKRIDDVNHAIGLIYV
jgi:hypothetical protein